METLEYKTAKHEDDHAENPSEAVHNPEVSQAEKECVERKNKYFKDFFFMRYGEVPQEHPVYGYLNEILGKLPNVEALDVKLRVIPDRFQSNAFALPDGTIAVTSHLIEFAEYYEALAGALAHEKVHVEKEHAKPLEEKAKLDYKDAFEYGLKKLAKGRLNEYEADLRAAFSDLEKAGINPLGFKVLLQKFAQREEGYGDVHGDSMDRALNVATGSYLMDLKSLSNDLHKIPNELIESVKQVSRPEFGAIFSRPKDYPGVFKPYAQRVEERHESIKHIDDSNKLVIALSTVGNYCKLKDTRGYDTDDDACMSELVEKTASYIKEKSGIADRQSILLTISYFSGVPIKTIDRYLGADVKSEKSSTPTAEVFSKVANAKLFECSVSSAPHYCSELIEYLNANKLLKKDDDDAIKSLDKAFYELESAYSISPPIKDEIVLVADRVLGKAEADKTPTAEKTDARSMWEKTEPVGSNRMFEMVRSNIGSLDVESIHKAIPRLARGLSKELEGKDPKEILSAIADVNFIFSGYVSTYVSESVELKEKVKDSTFILERYMTLKLFFQCAENLRLTKMIDKRNYDLLHLLFMYEFGGNSLLSSINDHVETYSHKPEQKEAEPSSHVIYDVGVGEFDEEPDYIEEAARDLENEDEMRSMSGTNNLRNREEFTAEETKIWMQIKEEVLKFSISESRVLAGVNEGLTEDAYKVFCDPKYRKDNSLNSLTNRMGAPSERGREFFARSVDIYSSKVTLPEFISFINKNQEQHELFISTVGSFSQSLGNISVKISKACEDGTLWQLPLKDIITISEFVHDPFIRSEILSKSFSENWPRLSFDEKVELLFPEKGKKGIVDFRLREKFLCEDVKTREQYDNIKKKVERSIDDLFNNTSVGIGGAVLADRISFKYSDPVRFLQGALATSENDQQLREWIEDFVKSGRSLFYNVDVPEAEGGKKINLIDEEEFITESVIQQLYNLDEVGRRMFVRKLLASQDGLLRSAENRGKFFDSIFDSWLKKENGQKDLGEVLERIKGSLAEEDSWELLYFAIQGILADKIFIPPKGITTRVMRQDVVAAIDKAKPTQRNREKVMLSTLRLRNTFESEGLTKTRKQKISPVEFVKETAGNLGALGRRFLQVLPQFVELSPDYEREFSDVYDKVAGQSKFAALATVEREWPEMWNELKEVGDRVGGGSIVTVYHTVDKEGKEGVLKVRNPNILYHLEEAQKVALSVSGRLASQYGESYKQARDIIPDINAWVTNDVNFESFLEKDTQFRNSYQEFTVEGNKYKIRIPESVGPANAYFSREEYVPGINLTSIDEIMKSEKHDAKQAIGLLAKFYVQQIMDGRLHSDIHPGNFSVTEKGELVVYDRNYYIDLTDQEKEAILSLFNPFADEQQKISHLRTLLNAGEEATPLLKEFSAALSGGDIGQAKKEIIKIKASGVTVPLNVTLLLKNISSIQSLAKKVGFSSIFDAVIV